MGFRLRSHKNRTTHSRRWGVVALATLLLAGAFVGVTATAADAGAMDVSIVPSSATTQKSGAAFTYNISLPCAGTGTVADANFCFDSVVTIPLDPAIGMDNADPGLPPWTYEVTGGPEGFVQSSRVDPEAHQLLITLKSPITAGTAQNISLSVTPPNLTTPDGTTWQLLPTVTSKDSTGATTQTRAAPAPAMGTATASVPLSVAKSTQHSFYDVTEGGFDYTVTVSCPATMPFGSRYASAIRVSDPLPEGVTFVSASATGAHYDEDTRTVSWDYSGSTNVPASCGGDAPEATGTQTITVAIDSPLADVRQVTNTVTAVATSIDGETGDPQTASRSVTLLPAGEAAPTGDTNITKDSVGQLHESDGAGVHGTYPGPWMPISAPASVTDPSAASYILRPRTAIGGYRYGITDDLPCLDDLATVVYTQAPSGVCARPAFHVTSIRLDVGAGVDGAAYPVPTYVRADGSDGEAVFDAGHSTATRLAWYIPAVDYDLVARLIFPPDASQEDRTADTITVNGYADASVTDGQVLRNSASIDLFWQDEATAAKTQSSNAADIDILDSAQIGTEKTMADDGSATSGRADVTLAATLVTPSAPSSDLIVTDLLPAGSRLITDPDDVTASLQRQRGAAIEVSDDLRVQVVDGFSEGRQLVRFTLPAVAFPALADRYRLAIGPLVISKPTEPGVYTNTADTFYDSSNLSGFCYAGDHGSDDPLGLRGSTTAVPANCEASATFKTVTSATDDYSLVKTVQGDLDDGPQLSPAIGHVRLDSGSAAYQLIWTNTGSPTLDDVVLYDLLPRVGDTGITHLQAGTPRNSQFAPVLTGVDAAPAGITISYTAAVNPCRTEVYDDALNTGCAPDAWTADPASIGGLANVTGIRVESAESYQTGTGFTIGFSMGVPAIDRDQVAWNSVAAAADDSATGLSAGITEAPAVGITGSLRRLGLDKTVDTSSAKPGDRLTYTITASNLGTGASTPTTVKDVLPAGLDFVRADGGGAYYAASRTVTWTLPAMDRDANAVFTVVATVGRWQDADQVVNRASIVDPTGYSPTIYEDPCPAGAAASCAAVAVPPSTLAFTGTTLSATIAGLLGGAAVLGGVAFVMFRRRRSRLS